MLTLLISYDLNRPGQDYGELYDVLREQTIGWWHHLDSTWIVTTNDTPTAFANRLLATMDANDKLLVVDITRRPAVWSGFNTKGSEWLKSTL